jgi:biotin-dependent carboxylase-like uncharacterized protein
VNLVAFGASALWIELEAPALATTLEAAAALRDAFPDADVVVGSGGVLLDGARASAAQVRDALAEPRPPAPPVAPRAHEIAVRYDGEDLDEVARAASLPVADVVARHAAGEYVVALLGFLPGFAYLEGLDPRLVLPRRASPRQVVPARSVAIAGAHTGIYPFASPGGWHLLGSADVAPFDPGREAPVLFMPGDRVRFRPSDDVPALPATEARPRPDAAAGVEVRLAPAGCTIQDGGRVRQLGRGLPPSGPLDVEAHAAANEAVGNAASTAAIEIPLGALEIVARGPVRVAIDGRPAQTLEDGARLRVEPEGRAVRYLAARGGFDVPIVLGARATLLVAHLGGFDGRAIRKGDVVPVGAPELAGLERSRAPRDPTPRPVRVVEGPHRDRFPPNAFERFVSEPWTVSHLADRVGVRLEGARVERRDADAGAPAPMIRGAVQITTDGTPIVLGPDHPTTGGYPVLAVVEPGSWSALAEIPPRGRVRFVA